MTPGNPLLIYSTITVIALILPSAATATSFAITSARNKGGHATTLATLPSRSILSLFFGGELDAPLPMPIRSRPPFYPAPNSYYAMTLPVPTEDGMNFNQDTGGSGGTDLSSVDAGFAPDSEFESNFLAQVPPYFQGQSQGADVLNQFPGPRPRPWPYSSYPPYPYSYPYAPTNPEFGYNGGIFFNPEFVASLLDIAEVFLTHLSTYYSSSANSPSDEEQEQGVEEVYDENYGYSQNPLPGYYEQYLNEYGGVNLGSGSDDSLNYETNNLFKSI